jgi:hypothetical protein
MSTFYEYDLGDGATILIEGPDKPAGGTTMRGITKEETIIKVQNKFTDAIKGARTQAQILLNEINELKVNEAEIKFGLTATGEVGNIAIGKIGMDVNYEVTLKWKMPEPK